MFFKLKGCRLNLALIVALLVCLLLPPGAARADVPAPPTNLVAIDPDVTFVGVDGSDFQVSWTPSVSASVCRQEIYILPLGTALDLSGQTPAASFDDNTSQQWNGTSSLSQDSGNPRAPLAVGDYTIYVVAKDASGSNYSSAAMTAVSETPALKVAGSATDNSVTMEDGNSRVSLSDNTWEIVLGSGALKSGAGDNITSAISVNGLPGDLKCAAVNGGANNIILTVSGAASTPVNSKTEVLISISGSAVSEAGAADSELISVCLEPASAPVIEPRAALLLGSPPALTITYPWQPIGDFTYDLYSDGTATVVKYTGPTGPDQIITIPEKVNYPDLSTSYTITAIAPSIFYEKEMKSVTVPAGVTTIPAFEFAGSSVQSVIFNGNLLHIKARAFALCKNLSSFTIPNTVTDIGEYAFAECTNLTTISVPSGVTGIGNNAFYKCSGLSTAYFWGAKPTTFGSDIFTDAAAGFKLYYHVKHAASWSGYSDSKQAFCKLTLDLNDGSGTTSNSYVDVDSSGHIAAPADPSSPAGSFGGWYNDPAGTDDFDFASDTVSDDITLYAKWVPAAAEPTITLTTTKTAGSNIWLSIEAAPADLPGVWIDLDGDNVKDAGEDIVGLSKKYTVSSPTITIHGKVSSLISQNNQLASLDISKNTDLASLNCSGNQLTSLDLSKNTSLQSLTCKNNLLASLDLSQNTVLNTLDAYSNKLSSLDVSHNSLLASLNCENNQIPSLDISKNTALTYLNCSGNQLVTLDLTNNTQIIKLLCALNQLAALDVTHCAAMTWLNCSGNLIGTLDLSKNTLLTDLYCNNNQLVALDLAANTLLARADCYNNRLTGVNGLQSTALYWLDCSGNLLTTLDISKNTALKVLKIYRNNIKGADMTSLLTGLPARMVADNAKLYIIDTKAIPADGNMALKSDVVIALVKNWTVYDWNNGSEIKYDGIASPASSKVAGTASDDSVSMAGGNSSVTSTDNSWEIGVTAGTLKGSSGSDLTACLTLSGLPAGLTWTAINAGTNKIKINVSGSASPNVNNRTTVFAAIKGSAVNEPGSNDSEPISLYLHIHASQTKALAIDQNTNTIYLANKASCDITVIDGNTDTVTATIVAGVYPSAIGVNPDTRKVYFTNGQQASAMVINGASNQVIATIPTGNSPSSLAINRNTNKIYIANLIGNSVTVIDGNTDAASATISTGKLPMNVELDPNINKIYVANNGGHSVSIIDGSINTITATVDTVDKGTYAVAVNPITGKVYVTNQKNMTDPGSVTVINGSVNAATIPVGRNPRAVAVNPVTNKIYVANLNDDTVTVIDGSTDTVLTTISTGDGPLALGIDRNTNKIFVANCGDDTVTIIDGATNTTSSVTAGDYPCAVAVNEATNKAYIANQYSDDLTIISSLPPIPTLKVAGTAADSAVTMAGGNQNVAGSDNTWEITVNTGTLKGSTGDDIGPDLIIGGLPAGLTWTATKTTADKILITIAGTASPVVSAKSTVTVVIKGSAVKEAGALASDPIALYINQAINANPGGGGGGGGGTVAAPQTKNETVETQKEPEVKTPAASDPVDLAGHWAHDCIMALLAHGHIKGYPDGTIRPDQEITRAEAAVLLVSILGFQDYPLTSTASPYSDELPEWARKAILITAEKGLMKGYPDGTFKPDQRITRAEMCAALMHCFPEFKCTGEAPTFADQDSIPEWALPFIQAAAFNKIVTGYPDNTFQPQGWIKRGEAFTIICVLKGYHREHTFQ
ncbi:MAG: S-layer homology domain-containing protein [Syntrophomonas sp.]